MKIFEDYANAPYQLLVQNPHLSAHGLFAGHLCAGVSVRGVHHPQHFHGAYAGAGG